MKPLVVATCQFSVEPKIEHNRRWILKQIDEAAAKGAHVAHFSECALSGYAGVDIPDVQAIDWDQLRAATRDVQQAARRRKVWVLLGSTHYLAEDVKPHNSVYVIDARGDVVDRYDKRFCTGLDGKSPTLDLVHYTPGDRFVTFKLPGFVGGVAICYDYRFPELYRGYKQLGAEIMFQSYHNARKSVVADPKYNIWRTIVPATMMCRAAENHLWFSANNSTTRPSKWGSFLVRPDGQILGRLPVHRPGVLVTPIERDPKLFDAPGPWRDAAIQGCLHSGRLTDHPRSRDQHCI